MRKQFAPKKAVLKSRGWETIEEIDDDSTNSDDEVDEEEEESVESEDGKEKCGPYDNDDNLALNKSSSDNNDSAKSGRMERFEGDIANTHAEVDRRREELNSRAQQGAECPPTDTAPAASVSSAFCGRDAGLTVPCGTSNAESIMKREKHVASRIIQFVKSELFCRIKFVNSTEMFQKAFVEVLQFKRVPPNNHVQLTYESCFNKALNTKRSSCEQLGAKLHGKQLSFSKNAEKTFSQLKNSVSSGEH